MPSGRQRPSTAFSRGLAFASTNSPSTTSNHTWVEAECPFSRPLFLSELLDLNRHDLELVAWSQEQDDAFGCDRFVLMTSIIRQIDHRQHQGRPITVAERNVARDLLEGQDTDRDSVCLIARIALLVAPISGESEEEKQDSIAEFATKRQTLLETIIAGNLSAVASGEAAAPTEGLPRLLQLRRRRQPRD